MVLPSEQALAQQLGPVAARAVIAYLRTNPAKVNADSAQRTALAQAKLQESIAALRAGDRATATRLALSAYLDGFEPIEPALAARDRALFEKIEAGMMAYRAEVKTGGVQQVQASAERFLGRRREDIMTVARETLEGNLRGVLSTMTPEQVNTDKETFAQRLAAEAEHDLDKLGLTLDTLKIQNVSDEVGYLDAMGRQRSAAIRRSALIAEAVSQAQAAEQRWTNTRNAELATLESQMQIAAKENERRVADAQSRRGAMIAQQQAEVFALIAQARGEVTLQEARIEQVRRQLQADIIQPAEAARRKAEEEAKGAAARVIEQGRATAAVLTRIAGTYQQGGTSSRDVLLMQKLVPLFERLAGTIGDLRIDRLTVLPRGVSQTTSEGSSEDGLGARLLDASEQVRAVTGVDLTRVLRDKLGEDGPPRAPIRPPTPR